MIPRIVPPLTELTILVTRPAAQAPSLCEEITRLGGTPVAFPTIEIEPIESAPSTGPHDLIVFVSVNAVVHGCKRITKGPQTRIAAIGRATAAALAEAQLPADIVPAAGFDSEALLAHPDLALQSGARILIVRGVGGRELMREMFAERGMSVETLEVYRRVQPPLDEGRRAALEEAWAHAGIDVVALTSVETLSNLLAMLSERGRALLATTPLVVASRRIAQAAHELGLSGEAIVAGGADDASMTGALAQWRMRARAG